MNETFPYSSDEQLAKYFAGELTAQEAAEIEAWAEQSPQNQDQLLQLRIIWMDTGRVDLRMPERKKYNVDAAWKKVKTKKQAADQTPFAASWIWKVAASIVLVAGVSLLLRFLFAGPDLLTYVSESSPEKMELEDGSKIFLNQDSKLTYPERFDKKSRIVKLQGEAFFEVEHQSQRPFIVQAGLTEVKVLGTSFNIKMEDGNVTVDVEAGKVLFSRGEDQVILIAGGKAVYSAETNVIKEQAPASSIGLDKFWRTKTLKFTGQKLPEVVQALEEAYGVFIKLENKPLENCSLSVSFENDSLDNVLDIIALTLNLEVKRTKNDITLSGKGCPAK